MSELGLKIARRYAAEQDDDSDLYVDINANDVEFMAKACVAIAVERDAARLLVIEACDLASPTPQPMPPRSVSELVPRLTNIGGVDVAERIKAIRAEVTK